MRLRRYWISFSEPQRPRVLNLGCGVTAHDYEDACTLVSDKIFNKAKMPEIKACEVDVDVSLLDAKHVLPNMGNVSKRGIWFPLGYD